MKRLFTLLVIILVLVGAGAIFWKLSSSPVDSKNQTKEVFIVKQGEGVRSISKRLKEEGIIKNSVVFFITVKKLGLDGKIQAGDHRISRSMTTADVAKSLTQGTSDVWITIREGVRAEEIADILERDLPSYESSWREELNKNEGYLFPDTYLIPKNADLPMVISILRNNFDSKYKALDVTKTALSQTSIVKIASLVEREARHDSDRPIVAGVILNRLKEGMSLDLDATLQYAIGYSTSEKKWWKQGLTNDDKEIASSYNTYRNQGLPPTPISNPGLESLQAVINPADTDYFYYISDKNGVNHYAKTLEEHEKNIDKYLR